MLNHPDLGLKMPETILRDRDLNHQSATPEYLLTFAASDVPVAARLYFPMFPNSGIYEPVSHGTVDLREFKPAAFLEA